MISIVAVNFNSPEFSDLLVESVERTRSEPIEIVIVDNSYQPIDWRLSRTGTTATTITHGGEKSHGNGLNIGLKQVTGDEVLILDIDCHLLQRGWEDAFRQRQCHCVTVAGPPEKPIRPACCFMKTIDARTYDWRSTPGYKGHRITPTGFDVGIIAYRQMISSGHEVAFMETTRTNRYGTPTGEEYGIKGEMFVYHHWHGTHLKERQVDYEVDLAEGKDLLFKSIPWRKQPKAL